MESVPFIRKGVGKTPAVGGCVMQIADWIATKGWSDQPECVHPAFRRLAIRANDTLPNGERQGLLHLIPRMLNTASVEKVVSVRLAIFCARWVLPVFEETRPGDERPREALEAAERWCDDPSEENHATATGATYAAHAAAYAAFHADDAADAAAYANAASAAAYAAHAAAYAAFYADDAADAAAHAAATAAGIAAYGLLVGLLDYYDHLTGRTTVAPVDFAPVCRMLEEASA